MMHRKISVVTDQKMHIDDNLIGQARYNEGQIALAPYLLESGREAGCVFWHEVWHHMMDILGEKELKENEKLSDQFGGMMTQMMATADWRGPK